MFEQYILLISVFIFKTLTKHFRVEYQRCFSYLRVHLNQKIVKFLSQPPNVFIPIIVCIRAFGPRSPVDARLSRLVLEAVEAVDNSLLAFVSKSDSLQCAEELDTTRMPHSQQYSQRNMHRRQGSHTTDAASGAVVR